MSISINRSSDPTTQFNNPLSGFFNTSNLEEIPVHSFTSPRQGSTTVIGKRIFSHSCLSPNTIEETPKYPIPIKVMSRLKRNNTQAKNLIKQKTLKSLKIKCLEQPAPVPNVYNFANSSMPKIKCKGTVQIKKYKKTLERTQKIKVSESKTTGKQLREKSSQKIKQIIKETVKGLAKTKKKVEMLEIHKMKRKLHQKVKLDEMNSKIRFDNSGKFKMEKFSPKSPWGLDQRKLSNTKEATAQIAKHREKCRTHKKSPEYQKKNSLGLSNFLEIGEEIGLKLSPSNAIKPQTSPLSTTRKKSNPLIQDFIKTQRKRSKEHQQDLLIEEIKKETKRIQNLKKLETVQSERKKKKKRFGSGRIFRAGGLGGLDSEEDNLKVAYDYSDSDDLAEIGSQLKQIVSKFSEDSVQENKIEGFDEKIKEINFNSYFEDSSKEKNEPQHEIKQLSSVKESKEQSLENPENKAHSIETQNKAARMIQNAFRAYLLRVQESRVSSYYSEDNEVQEILAVWKNNQQQDPSPKRAKTPLVLSTSEIEESEEIQEKEPSEIKELTQSTSQNPDLIDFPGCGSGNRAKNALDLLQNSLRAENPHFSDSLQIFQTEFEDEKEIRILDYSLPSSSSEKSVDGPIKAGLNSIEVGKNKGIDKKAKSSSEESISDFVITENTESDAPIEEYSDSLSADYIDSPYAILISRGSPIKQYLQPQELKNNLKTITSSEIISLSESILSTILQDITPPTNPQLSIEKSPKVYIDQLVPNIPESLFTENLKKPLHKNPLEILFLMHNIQIGYSENYYKILGDPVLSTKIFSSLSSKRPEYANEEIKTLQKSHDRLLFDNCNFELNRFRAYAAAGRPMPWDCFEKVGKGKGGVSEIMTKVAMRLEKIDAVKPLSEDLEGVEENNEEAEMRYLEAKIKALVVQDAEDGEGDWVDYRFEDTQEKINAAEVVLKALLEEIIDIMECVNEIY